MAPGERFLLARDRRLVVLSADSGHGFKFGALTGEDVAEALDGGDFDAVARRLAGELRRGRGRLDAPPARAYMTAREVGAGRRLANPVRSGRKQP
jgi:glycine/D-amino acid oxidase-like deaminating enzyme